MAFQADDTVASSSSSSSTAAHAFVTRHLGDAIAAFPPPVRDALVDKFVAEYEDPRTAPLEGVLRKRLTDNEVRHLQFAPAPAQYRFYAALLSLRAPFASADGARDDPTCWQFVLRKRFLAVFYLKHARNWPLVVEFILHDGLQVLVDMFLHEDLQLCGQAIDSFVQITSNPRVFEWFDEPVGYEARMLHAKMVALAAPGAGFLRSVVASIRLYEDADGPKRLPGGTFVLLQVLAFFLSWVRKFYTRNELRLSRELLELLRDWRQRTRCDNDEELRLAQQVYDDFSRWPAIEDSAHDSRDDDNATDHIAQVDRDTRNAPKKDVFSRAVVDELVQLAATSDDGALEEAIALCSEAVDANVSVVDALLSRARTRLRRVQLLKAEGTNVAVATAASSDDAQLCLRDCSAVTEREPANMDAWRCQLTMLETMEMWGEARDVLDAWHARHARQDDGDSAFLCDDVVYLAERRAFFDDKAHEAQQRAAAAQRQHASREAKQQHVYRLLLQRATADSNKHRVGSEAATCTAAAATRVSTPKDETTSAAPSATTTTTTTTSSRDVLARFRAGKPKSSCLPTSSSSSSSSSSPLIADAPLDGVVKARVFVRKWTQRKRDVRALRRLLRSANFQDVVAAMETALPDDSLTLMLEALVSSVSSSSQQGEEEEEEEDANASTARLLRRLLALPRFALVKEMASPVQQQRIRELEARTHAMLDTAWAA